MLSIKFIMYIDMWISERVMTVSETSLKLIVYFLTTSNLLVMGENMPLSLSLLI